MTKICFTLVTFVTILRHATSSSGDGESSSIIGRGFYLPGIPFAGKTLSDGTGYQLFKHNFVQRCIQGPFLVQESKAQLRYYCNSETFYKSISSRSGLHAEYSNYFTLGASVNLIEEESVWTTEGVSGSSIDYSITTDQYTLDLACIQKDVEYNEDFMQAFRSLPTEVTNPHLSTSWAKYDSFLKVYGSHIMTGLSLGARIQYYATSSSNAMITSETFGARACADFAAPIPVVGGTLSVSGCNSFTTEELMASQSVSMNTITLYFGGDGTHAASTTPPTTDEAELFLSSAYINPSAINYEFALAIWDHIIADLHDLTSDDLLRAINLKSYYLGFKAFGCQYVIVDGIVLQAFIYSSKEYQCSIAGEGCHSEADCHLDSYYSACFCYGKTCVVHSEDSRWTIQEEEKGDKDEVPNESCYWDEFDCKCSISGNTVAWPQQQTSKRSFHVAKQVSQCSANPSSGLTDSSSGYYNLCWHGNNLLIRCLFVLLTSIYTCVPN